MQSTPTADISHYTYRVTWAAEDHDVVSLVGRDPRLLLRAHAPGRRAGPHLVGGHFVASRQGRQVFDVACRGNPSPPSPTRAAAPVSGWRS